MKMLTKGKRGFTLLEMMLSIAIITIVSGCLYTLVFSIKDSYINTYNSDDSTDYAMLYARALENSFLANTQSTPSSPATSGTWKVADYTIPGTTDTTKCVLTFNDVPVFTTSQNKVAHSDGTVEDKWKIVLAFTPASASGVIRYRIVVYDNYYNPGKIKFVYNGALFSPHISSSKFSVTNHIPTGTGIFQDSTWYGELKFDKDAV